MSILKTKYIQLGDSLVANNNFTIYQPPSEDGTLKIAFGNADGPKTDVLSIANTGTIATVSGSFAFTGNTTIGDAASDTLTINAGTTTFAQGTANGVLYLNGSKVATSGSGLVFDGTKLIASGGNEAIRIANAAPYYSFYNAAQSTLYGYIQHTGTDLALVNVQNGAMPFYVNNTETARFTSKGLLVGYTSDSGLSGTGNAIFSGNVGIGTSPPGAKLDVRSGASPNLAAVLVGLSGSNNYYAANTHIWQNGASTETMRLDSSGNLGLGVTPSAWGGNSVVIQGPIGCALTFNKGAAENALVSNGYYNGSEWRYTTSAPAARYSVNGYNGTHLWETAPSGTAGNAISFTQAMTLDASGNLGIGTSSPGYQLDLQGGTTNNSRVRLLRGTDDPGQFMTLGWDNISVYRNVSLVNPQTSISFNQVGSDGTRTPLHIDSSGNVGIGTSSPGTKLNVVGTEYISEFSTLSSTNGTTARIAVSSPVAQGKVELDWVNNSAETGGGYAMLQVGKNANSPSFRYSAGDHRFSTNGAERLRIDFSGNLGLGVTPSAWASGYSAMQIQRIGLFGSSSLDLNLASNMYLDNVGYKYVANGYATNYIQYLGQHQWLTATSGTAGNPIVFTQAMTLDASGNLLVAQTSASYTTLGASIRANGAVSSASASDFWNSYSTLAGAYRFYVTNAGTVYATNTTIAAISDQRLKENIQDLDVGLSSILALKPRKFDWKEGKGKDIKGDRGFIAQEFEQVFPDLIDTWKDEPPEGEEPYKSVRQDLIPVLVKAVQELHAEIESQKALNQSLLERINQLETK